MYTLLFELIDFLERNINSEYFLFTNLTIMPLFSVVLLRPWGKWWQPSISAGFIIMLEFLQISITLFSRSSSGISFKIPDISTLFLLLYCSALARNFSRLTIQFCRLMLTFLTITNSLVIFSFADVTWFKTFCKLFYLIIKIFDITVKNNFTFHFLNLLQKVFFFSYY